MRYELYVDSLFLINLCMNLYLLMLVEHSTPGATGPGRLAAGAAAGAIFFLLPFMVKGPALIKLVAGGLAGTVGMLCIAFPVRRLRMFLKLLERLLLYSFGIGGGLLFLIARLPFLREYLTGVSGILCAGGLICLLFRGLYGKVELRESVCRATLIRGEQRATVAALIDSGNSLTEPISGKKVCVVDEELYQSLWGEEQTGCRVIPYHSVGKEHGLMLGYLLPRLMLEMDGMVVELSDVYVAVSKERISGAEGEDGERMRMIVNPGLLEGENRPSGKRHGGRAFKKADSAAKACKNKWKGRKQI